MYIAITLPLASCVTLGTEAFKLPLSAFQSHYHEIKMIVMRDAAKNGYGNLTSYVKPSKYTGWKGHMYFSVKTDYGTDELRVEFFLLDGSYEAVSIIGAGMEGKPHAAEREILGDIRKLGSSAESMGGLRFG